MSNNSKAAQDGHAAGSGYGISPSLEWLFECAGDDGRPPDDAFYVTLVSFDVLLCQVLRERVRVRKGANQFLLVIINMLIAHGHDLARYLLGVLLVVVDHLLD